VDLATLRTLPRWVAAALAFGLLDAPTAGAQPLPAVLVAPAEQTEVSELAVFTGRAVAIQKECWRTTSSR
jgi:hypothetical protein